MNICLIAPNPNTKDGIAQYSYKLADHLYDEGNNLILLTPKSGGVGDKRYHKPLIGLGLLSVLSSLKEIKSRKSKVIHVQYAIPTYGVLLFNIWAICFISRIFYKSKIVITLHEVKRETDLLGILAKIYFFLLSNLANVLIVHTKQGKEILQTKCWINANKIKEVPLFLMPKEETEKYSRSSKIINIVYFGYIHIDKGIEYLVDAVRILRDEYHFSKSEIHCIIAGDIRPRKGLFKFFESKDINYKKMIFDKIKDFGLEEYIHSTGFIAQNKVSLLLNSASIFVLPYINTEQSGVLHSVLQYNKPIIASRIGGIAETLNDSGILVEPRSSKQIAEEIAKLIHNPRYYESTIKKYEKLIKSHEINKISKSTLEIYNHA